MCRVLDPRVDFGRNVGKEQVGNNSGCWGGGFGNMGT